MKQGLSVLNVDSMLLELQELQRIQPRYMQINGGRGVAVTPEECHVISEEDAM